MGNGKKSDISVEGRKIFTKSMFGPQVASTKPSAPTIGFGTSRRDAVAKQYVSREHSRSVGGSYSQGAIYKIYSSLGSQPISNRPSSARFHFGTSTRDESSRGGSTPGPGTYKNRTSFGTQQESNRASSAKPIFGTSSRDGAKKIFIDPELAKTMYGSESPPPNIYSLQSSIGKQTISCKKSSPSWCLGTANRFKEENSRTLSIKENCIFYNLPGSVGTQISSEKTNSPSYGFGSSTRDKFKKVFISVEHEKQNFGECSPGPVTGRGEASFGKQKISTRASSPGWVFSTSKREEMHVEKFPGPGSYCV